MSDLGRSVGMLSAQRASVAVLGVARTKIAATLLGPAGVGLLAQAVALQDILRAAATLGTRNGFLKLVAEHSREEDREALERLVGTALTSFGLLALTLSSACLLLADEIAPRVFGSSEHRVLVWLVGVSVVFAVPAGILNRTLSGLLDVRAYVFHAIVSSAGWLLAMAALASAFGLRGAVGSLLVAEALGFAVAVVLLVRRVVRARGVRIWPSRPDPQMVRRLLRLAGALSITSLSATGAALLVRSELLRQQGAEANGLYQVAWQVGQNYLALLGNALWAYGMPRVATERHDPVEVNRIQNEFAAIALGVMAPGVLFLLATNELWVPILFSSAFGIAASTLAFQLGGEMVAMLRQSMNISLLPREKLGFLVTQGLGYWGLWVGLSLIWLPEHGGAGVAAAYAVANLAWLGLTWLYHHVALGYRLERGNLLRMLAAAPLFVIGAAAVVLDAAGGGAVAAGCIVGLVFVGAPVVWRLWRGSARA